MGICHEVLGWGWGHLTRVLAALAALDEAEEHQNQDEEDNGADKSDEPTFRSKVFLSLLNCRKQ